VIVLSVAHTFKAQGAAYGGLTEYEVSKRATRAAYDWLSGQGIPCCLFETGSFSQTESVRPKQLAGAMADLSVEMHLNAWTDPARNFSEVIHHPGSIAGFAAACAVSDHLKSGFGAVNHKWPAKGPRGDAGLFFLKGPRPAIIVEGLFLSNPEQAAWLATPGAPETYGLLVAGGLKQWWLSR